MDDFDHRVDATASGTRQDSYRISVNGFLTLMRKVTIVLDKDPSLTFDWSMEGAVEVSCRIPGKAEGEV